MVSTENVMMFIYTRFICLSSSNKNILKKSVVCATQISLMMFLFAKRKSHFECAVVSMQFLSRFSNALEMTFPTCSEEQK